MEGLNKDTQLKINFENNNEAKSFEEEQKEAGIKYGILAYTELEKRSDGEWYMHGIKAQEYNDIMSSNDNSDMHRKTP